MIFVNFKTYPEATGENSVKLALLCEVISEETKVPIIPVVQLIDAWRILEHVHIPVWVQHIDPFEPGGYTGYTIFESIISGGVSGTILNHSEHSIPFEQIKNTIMRVKKERHDFQTLVCVPNMEVLKNVKSFEMDYVAYEPPELIGSKTASVASVHPEIIEESVALSSPIPVIVGAGIKTKADVETCHNKGVKGILVASSIVKAKDPAATLREFASVFASS
jgi:triosephosphate isomerase